MANNEELQARVEELATRDCDLTPFDAIGDTLRGTRGIVMDMYRQPEKLLQAMEAIPNHDWHGNRRGTTDRQSSDIYTAP